MTMSNLSIILTSLIGVLTIVGGAYTALQARSANKESTVVSGYDTLVAHLQQENDSQREEIRQQGDRIVLLEHRIEMFLRWGRSVIRWYESIEYHDQEKPLPIPHPLLELNGEGK